MSASRYIGRVGGLAVALGVGAAIFTGNGIAWAEPVSGGSTSGPGTSSSAGGGAEGGESSHGATPESGSTHDTSEGSHAPNTSPSTSDDKPHSAVASSKASKANHPKPLTRTKVGKSATVANATSSQSGEPSTPRDGEESSATSTSPGTVDAPVSGVVDTPTIEGSSSPASASSGASSPSTATTKPEPVKPAVGSGHATTAAATANLIARGLNPLGGSSPKVPAQTPTSWVVAAAARRELPGAAATAEPAKQIVASQAVASSANATAAAAPVAPAALRAANLPELVHLYIYAPIHTALEHWINTANGQRFAAFVNTVLRSYAIGDGSDGTSAANPDGTAAGWLFGDGGRGWASTEAGTAGGKGGAAGIFGNGGTGGTGGAGASGGTGGAGGKFMGIGGTGGAGGVAVADGEGGAGGHGGSAPGLFFGIGGSGGDGNDGGVGGAGGDDGNATGLLGNGGRGGNGGNGDVTGHLPALGGAGGQTVPGFGSHGAVGNAGAQAGITLTPPAGTPIPGGSVLPIGTTGTWLTDNNGNVVILHGTNQVDINPPLSTPAEAGFGDDDAAFLAANGFNVVRVGVDWSRLQPQPGVYDDAYLASIQQTVQTLSNHGIVTLLDMHQNVGPDWATGGPLPPSKLPFPISLFFDPAQNHALDMFWKNQDAPNGIKLQNNYAQMMQHLASYFNGNPGVLGIEIMNEPLPGNQTLPSIFGSGYFEGQQLTPFYNQVAAAVRSVNATTTIFYEPSFLATAMVPIRLGTVNDSNSVFSFHNYAYVNLGPLGVLPFVGTIEDNAARYARAHGIPAFMTEFGSSSNQSSINQTVNPADHDLIGWTEWSYSNTGFGGIDGTPEWLVNDPSQPLVGGNINAATLATLAKPYPQLVAGTPGAFSFDNGTFRFSYSTERVDGLGQFAAGSQTVIAVPAVQYPNGYQVSVTGGHVVSAPNAPQLVIASDGGVGTVTVTVSAVVTV